MKRMLTAVGALLLVTIQLRAQAPQVAPAFEIADVHPSPPSQSLVLRGGTPRNGLYRVRKATMVDLIRMAYGVDPDQVAGGPSWLEWDRFDIVARVPETATRESIKPMLRKLLADRFNMVVREETRSFPGLALVRGVGQPRLKESSGAGPSGCGQEVRGQAGATPLIELNCHAMSLGSLASQLARIMGSQPIVDATGLAGTWDFVLGWPMESAGGRLSMQNPAGITEAVEKQLGLTLETRSVPMPTLTVVSANRVPTPNSPAVAAAFPAGTEPEFEAAQLKPAMPGRPEGRSSVAGGQINSFSVPMRLLISVAYDLVDRTLVSGPKSLDTPLYDFVAKLSATSVAPEDQDSDVIRVMLKRFLEDRLHLKTHFEDRAMDAPVLTATASPHLTKSDPNSRTRCVTGTPPLTSGPAIQVKCQNVTLAEFASRLQPLDTDRLKMPVVDQTALDGRWDITVTFTPQAMLNAYMAGYAAGQAAAAAQGGPRSGAAIEPPATLDLAQALDRQLGLKLDNRRRPVQIVVVDSIDENPLTN
jgi:uncharacterized protein (TIGR03435 family)